MNNEQKKLWRWHNRLLKIVLMYDNELNKLWITGTENITDELTDMADELLKEIEKTK